MNYLNARSLSSSICLSLFCLMIIGSPTFANDNPFTNGWILDTSSSSLTFQTIKNGSKLETSSFASYQGEVDSNGNASLRIQLDSVDTKVDLRNVRMRFLLFETFKFPQATVTAKIDPAQIAGLATTNRVQLPLSFDLDLHGVKQTLQTQAVVTAIAGNQVSVASAAPISIPTNLFNLDEGVKKLEEAATVTIVPMGSVSFNLVFDVSQTTTAAPVQAATGAAAAVETTGDFSKEECAGRLEILSRTQSIYFRVGSADLDPKSSLILDAVMDIIQRCPTHKVVVAGHTDSDGTEELNQELSERRARSVAGHMITNNIDPNRLISVGYGENKPIASNDTKRGKWRNRRIDFTIDDGNSTTVTTATAATSANTEQSNNRKNALSSGPLIVVDTSLGEVIAGGVEGKTLYIFAQDNGSQSACYGACAAAWPPFVGGDPAQETSTLSATNRSDGTVQWVYKGQPLYFWAGDTARGQTTGANIPDWAVARP